jgi:Beta-lactamase enzyme family
MLSIDAPPPPVIEQPAPYQVSYGLVTGEAAAGTRRIVVRLAGGRVLGERALRQRRFSVRIDLPVGETAVRVVGIRQDGTRAGTTIRHVFGLPRASRPRYRLARLDAGLATRLRRVARGYRGTAGVYVQSLTSGAGAAWNARARFPAASTLKLAIAIAVLDRHEGVPRRGSYVDGLLRGMLHASDNASANALEVWLAGSTSSGSHRVEALLRTIGVNDSLMYGGYEIERRTAAAIPRRIDAQPGWGYGKYTTAYDLTSMLRAVWLASGGHGPLRRHVPGFTAADGRYLLYLLAHVRDHGKLDRELGVRGVRVLHKAGWVDAARHDAGLVFWRGGVYMVAVMTYRAAGTGLEEDVLAGRVARLALARFRG